MKHSIGFVVIASVLAAMMSFTTLAVASDPASGSATVIPQLIKFSGVAKGTNGQPLTGMVGITFALYQDQQGGSPLWLETQNVQPDPHGNYTVQLGATLPNGLPAALFTTGEARWVGVQISGQEEQPRVILLSVPYAMKAGDAQTLNGQPASAFLTASSSNAANPNGVINNAITGGGTTDYVPLWLSKSKLGNSKIFQSAAGDLGIGTTSPAANLDVNGTGDVRDTLTLFPKSTDNTLAINGTTFNINSTGTVSFVSGQTFPGTGTITGVTAGAGLTGGGTSGKVTLSVPNSGITNPMLQYSSLTVTAGTDLTGGGAVSLGGSTTLNVDTTKVPQLGSNNTFSGAQTINNNVTVTATGTTLTASGGTTGLSGTGSGNGVYGNSSSGNGVYGSTSDTTGKYGGVGGMGTYGWGVWGYTWDTTGSYAGVLGQGYYDAGVYGYSSTNNGVYGDTSDTTGAYAGVYGSSSSLGTGVYGSSSSGDGVYGTTSNTTGNYAGVYGYSVNSGVGVVGYSYSGDGVYGSSSDTTGAYAGVYGSSSSAADGVAGINSSSGSGVYGSSSTGAGVSGYSSSGNGVYGGSSGTAAGTSGVYGLTSASSSNQLYGVLGINSGSNYGAGVYGQDATSNSRSGTGSNWSYNGAGVWGDGGTSENFGVVGTADNHPGGQFENNSSSYSTLWAVNNNASGYPFGAFTSSNKGCQIDPSGDINCTGKKNAIVPIDGGQRTVALSAIESPKSWFEDFGSAQLSHGSAVVAIEPEYGQTVNTELEYHVFLTPNGDCKGLYVSQRTPTSFEVRELGGGASSIEFSYRIVALRKNYESIRMEDHTRDLEVVKNMMAKTGTPPTPFQFDLSKLNRPERPAHVPPRLPQIHKPPQMPKPVQPPTPAQIKPVQAPK
jgi:hypothetical protein